MANKVTMTFKKGDNQTHYFKLPIADYVEGGTLYFVAKPAVDNDATDAAAVIDKSFTDSVVTEDAEYATWELEFEPGDITGVNFSDGENSKKYIGEFQLVAADGSVSSFPDNNNYIEVIIYADIKRATA